jgi:hypothetical protein
MFVGFQFASIDLSDFHQDRSLAVLHRDQGSQAIGLESREGTRPCRSDRSGQSFYFLFFKKETRARSRAPDHGGRLPLGEASPALKPRSPALKVRSPAPGSLARFPPSGPAQQFSSERPGRRWARSAARGRTSAPGSVLLSLDPRHPLRSSASLIVCVSIGNKSASSCSRLQTTEKSGGIKRCRSNF